MDRILTRTEEYLLLAVIKLGKSAYPVTIFNEIRKADTSGGTLGAIYLPLQRLEESGLLTSYLGHPTAERGGKSRRYYRITEDGLKALEAARKTQEAMWRGIKWVPAE
ncbi:MAG: helix-turn-helix transcriptional regulator [Candidatus Aminicenantes bacterium]|nr:helix-turn-helix transcriptional regulator [Candidatus Aminicenantes bacterium]